MSEWELFPKKAELVRPGFLNNGIRSHSLLSPLFLCRHASPQGPVHRVPGGTMAPGGTEGRRESWFDVLQGRPQGVQAFMWTSILSRVIIPDRASVGICGGSTSPLTGLKGSAANVPVPDTTGHTRGRAESKPWWVGDVFVLIPD